MPTSDLVVHVVIDEMPEAMGTLQADGGDRCTPLRIIEAPISGALYNRWFSLAVPPGIVEGTDALFAAIERAATSPENHDRVVGSAAFDAVRHHGAGLYAALCGSMGNILQGLLRQADFEKRSVLILLQFGDRSKDLAGCVWESVCDEAPGGRGFHLHRGTVARYVPAGRLPAPPAKEALRVLVVQSTYDMNGGLIDPALEAIAEADYESLRSAMAPLASRELIELLEPLRNPRSRELNERLRDDKVDLLHFIGHGGVDDREEFLVLRGAHDRGEKTHFKELQHVFNEALNLRLVVLNACRLEASARLGMRLVGEFGIPAVITMRTAIGAETVALGFTMNLYREVAAGKAVHQAFRAGLNGVWFTSPVETFVPTLTLGLPEPYVLIDPERDEARAIRLENAQQRSRIEAMLEGIREAWARLDEADLARRLRDASPYAKDPLLVSGLENLFQNIKGELKRLESAAQWPQAQRCADALRQTSELLSVAFRDDAGASVKTIKDAIEAELRSLRGEVSKARTRNAFPDVVRAAERYLALKPSDTDVTRWLDEAREFVAIAGNITVDDAASANAAFIQLEGLVRAGDVGKAQALFMAVRGTLTPHQASTFQREILLAEARVAMARGDWQTGQRAARSAHQIQPDDLDIREVLSDAVLAEAGELFRSGLLDQAKAKCREAMHIEPGSKKPARMLVSVYLDLWDGAGERGDWPALERLSREVLDDQSLAELHPRAADLHKEAAENTRLWGKIRILG